MSYVSYPRLAGSHASELLVRLSRAERHEMLDIAAEYEGRRTFYATAAVRADDARLRGLREAVAEHARHCDYPRNDGRARFDEGLPKLLHDRLGMSPAEAGVADVWNYLTLVLLPDVALWRWPNPARDPGYERLVGKPRNVFRRHWWRAHLLGDGLATLLGEDEIVQIVERSATLGGNPRVARAVGHAFLHGVESSHIEVAGAQLHFRRMEVMRSLAKRVLRVARVVALSTLGDEELAALMRELVERTLAHEAEKAGGGVGERPLRVATSSGASEESA